MAAIVLAVNPVIEMVGQIAAIIICLFALIYVILAVVLNAALAFGMSWLKEKIDLIKMLRPSVDSVNKASEDAIQGVSPAENQSPIVRTVSSLPVRVHDIDQKVDQSTERVVNAAIEFRARTVQVKTVLKAFFLPGAMQRERLSERVDGQGLEFNSPGYRALMEQQVAERPSVVESGNGHAQEIPASQLKHVSSR